MKTQMESAVWMANSADSGRAFERRQALRSVGTWLVFLIFSIALITLLPREAQGWFATLSS